MATDPYYQVLGNIVAQGGGASVGSIDDIIRAGRTFLGQDISDIARGRPELRSSLTATPAQPADLAGLAPGPTPGQEGATEGPAGGIADPGVAAAVGSLSPGQVAAGFRAGGAFAPSFAMAGFPGPAAAMGLMGAVGPALAAMGVPAAQAFAQNFANVMAYATLEEAGPLEAALLGLNIQGPVFNNPYTGLGISGLAPNLGSFTGFGGTGGGPGGGTPGAGEGPDAGVGEAP